MYISPHQPPCFRFDEYNEYKLDPTDDYAVGWSYCGPLDQPQRQNKNTVGLVDRTNGRAPRAYKNKIAHTNKFRMPVIPEEKKENDTENEPPSVLVLLCTEVMTTVYSCVAAIIYKMA